MKLLGEKMEMKDAAKEKIKEVMLKNESQMDAERW